MGFNSVRLPWSNAMLDQDPGPCPAAQPGSMLVCVPPEVLTANPALQNQHAMDIYSQIVQALTSAGLMVILDNHGTDAAWTPGKFNLSGLWWGGQFWDNRFGGFGAKRAARTSQWVNDWVTMVNRFSANPYVIGADLRNEPSSTPYSCVLNTKCTAQWGSSVKSEDWLAAAVRAGTAILNANTNLLIFVESIDLALDGFPSAVPLPAGHVVDSVHYYPGDHTANWTPVVGTTPVWVGEVGITISCIDNPSTCGPKETPAFATNFMQLVNSYPPGEIGWSWWPVNKTHSDEGIEGAGSGTTFYDHETYGLLSNSWNEEASQSLMGDLGFPPT